MLTKRKFTGISNSYLDNDVYFLHFYTMCSIFAPVQNGKITDIYNKNEARVIKLSDYEIKINRSHLNMNKHFLMYCFLLKKFEALNYNVKKSELFHSVEIPFDEILDFWNEEKYKETLLNEFNEILDVFISTIFTIKIENQIVKSGLISKSHYDSDERIFKISFSKEILDIFDKNKRQTFFDIKEFKKIQGGIAKKLYLFLLSYGRNKDTGHVITSFNYNDIRQLVGYDINHIVNDNNVLYRNYDDADSRRKIKKALNELHKIGFIKEFKSKSKQTKFNIFQIRHEAKPKKKSKKASKGGVEVQDSADNIDVSNPHVDTEHNELTESQLQYIKDCYNNIEEDDDLDLSPDSLEDIPVDND